MCLAYNFRRYPNSYSELLTLLHFIQTSVSKRYMEYCVIHRDQRTTVTMKCNEYMDWRLETYYSV